jgi:hypothetical protein
MAETGVAPSSTVGGSSSSSSGKAEPLVFDMSPVDFVARGIVEGSLFAPRLLPELLPVVVYHPIHPGHLIPVDWMVQAVKSRGFTDQLKAIPEAEWRTIVADRENAFQPLALQFSFATMRGKITNADNSNFMKVISASQGTGGANGVTVEVLGKYVEFLIQKGACPKPPGGGGGEAKAKL